MKFLSTLPHESLINTAKLLLKLVAVRESVDINVQEKLILKLASGDMKREEFQKRIWEHYRKLAKDAFKKKEYNFLPGSSLFKAMSSLIWSKYHRSASQRQRLYSLGAAFGKVHEQHGSYDRFMLKRSLKTTCPGLKNIWQI